MAHEILSVKLCELEEQLSRLSSRIYLCESAGQENLRHEIKTLAKECAATELALQKKLQMSRAAIVSTIAGTYREIERIIQSGQSSLRQQTEDRDGTEAAAEKKILLAEYALDFAALAANRALLLSMEAIDAQLTEEGGKTS